MSIENEEKNFEPKPSVENELKMLQLIAYDTSLETLRNATQEMEPEDFSDEDYRLTFGAFQEAARDGEAPDLVMMMRRMPWVKADPERRNKLLDVFSGNVFFADCQAYYRTLFKSIRDARVNEMLSARMRLIYSFIQEQRPGTIRQLEEALEQARDLQCSDDNYELSENLIDKAMFSIGENKEKIKTGFVDVDKMLFGGFDRGTLNVIGARPSTGKSTFAMNLAMNILFSKNDSGEMGNNIVYFTLEDPAEKTLKRCELYIANASEKEIRDGSPAKAQDVLNASEMLKAAKKRMWIINESNIRVGKIAAVCRKAKSKMKHIDLIVIDYLTLMDKELRSNMAMHEAIGRITRILKGLAIELNVPVVLLSQTNRASENRTEPMLSDLRDSGSIEQDADTVMFLYRELDDEMDEEMDAARKSPKLKLAKNRDGETGKIDLVWIPDKYTFRCKFKGTGDSVR